MKHYCLILASVFCLHLFSQSNSALFSGPPAFHGAKITGNYPNTEFIFAVPVTGERPLTYSAENLPPGLSLNPNTGIINGVVKERGHYKVNLHANNKQGKADSELEIVIGDTLCLTPVMGWNSWNVFTRDIDEKMLMEMADAMVSTGMRDVGYQYLNIDDFWHADSRDASGKPVADAKKFPHGIKYVADYVHSKGLKLGIYSCAGNMTCGRCFGGYTYEEIDAKTYAEWGIDLLKYDYCYAPWTRKPAVERYTKMGNALKASGRSIVFSVCEWGIRKPWLWAAKAGGNYWRTTPDIIDAWGKPTLIFYNMKKIIHRNEKLAKYAGPGHWNDPDMLTVGNYGKGKATAHGGMFKGMTDTEYQTQMILWCMFNAPLLTSCDLRSMNEATSTIITNTAILDVNQQSSVQAELLRKKNGIRIYKKSIGKNDFVAVLNTGKKDIKKTFWLGELTSTQKHAIAIGGSAPAIYDLVNKKEYKDYKIELSLRPHETIILKIADK